MSDLDIGEDEVLKLATLGNGTNSKETVDTLTRSLVLRNRLIFQILIYSQKVNLKSYLDYSFRMCYGLEFF